MKEKLDNLSKSAIAEISGALSTRELADVKVKYLGKNGELTALLKGLKDVPIEQKPAVGKMINDVRIELEDKFAQAAKALEDIELAKKLAEESIDITINEKKRDVGSLHPLTVVRDRLTNYFVSLGFKVADGPEIETDYYNFEALNTPEDHPARDAQDTFYITGKFLLRSQTSTGQIRTMEKFKPPLKMISPGRVYRSDDLDATHSPMFHQFEGLVVDKGITMCDLKGILDMFAKHFFGSGTKVRFRPSYFPFTEPSVEVDTSCGYCGGTGCRACKGTGWIELLGAGMVNRHVLSGCGIDPDVYTGFAFGMGVDRLTHLLYGTEFRAFFENDIRFLKQFK